jgi:hypothetical protein
MNIPVPTAEMSISVPTADDVCKLMRNGEKLIFPANEEGRKNSEAHQQLIDLCWTRYSLEFSQSFLRLLSDIRQAAQLRTYEVRKRTLAELVELAVNLEKKKKKEKKEKKKRGNSSDGTTKIDFACDFIIGHPNQVKISNKDLAKIVGCSPTLLSSKKAKPRLAKARAIAKQNIGQPRSGYADGDKQPHPTINENGEEWAAADARMDGE